MKDIVITISKEWTGIRLKTSGIDTSSKASYEIATEVLPSLIRDMIEWIMRHADTEEKNVLKDSLLADAARNVLTKSKYVESDFWKCDGAWEECSDTEWMTNEEKKEKFAELLTDLIVSLKEHIK